MPSLYRSKGKLDGVILKLYEFTKQEEKFQFNLIASDFNGTGRKVNQFGNFILRQNRQAFTNRFEDWPVQYCSN
jgi:Zn/Cd-binding protein ZinT